MTDIALAVLAEFKRIQMAEDGNIYMDFEGHIACTVVEGSQKPLYFNFAEYESSILSILEALLSEGCIKREMRDFTYIRVTHKGWHYAEQLAAEERARAELLEQVRQQRAQEERNKAFERKLGILNLLIPLITFILGLFVQYFARIVEWVGALFQ